MSKISEYVNSLNLLPGYRIGVEIQGLLGVVKNNEEIIFTTAGAQSVPVVEAFLGGIMYSELKNLK